MTSKKTYILNGLVALGLGILGLYFKESYALVLLLGLIYLSASFFHPLAGLGIVLFSYCFLPDILSLALVLGYGLFIFVTGFFRKDRALSFSKDQQIVYLWMGLLFLATLTSTYFRGSLRDLAIHSGGFFLFLMMVSLVKTKKDFYYLLFFLMLGLGLLSLYGVIQIFTGVEMKKEWLDVENNPDVRVRVYSVFGNPNIFAEYLEMLLPLALGLMWAARTDKRKIFYGGLFILGCIALGFTLSRGGLIGLFAGLCFFIFFVRKRLFLLGIPALAGAIYLMPQGLASRISSIFNFADSSTSYRFTIWENTLKVIKDHPLGLGLGHLPFKQTFEQYVRTIPTFHAHNTYLEITAELGYFGLLVFLIFLLAIFVLGYKYLLTSKEKDVQIIGAGLLAGLFGVLVHGLFENVFYLTKITLTVWILIGLVFALIGLGRKEASHD